MKAHLLSCILAGAALLLAACGPTTAQPAPGGPTGLPSATRASNPTMPPTSQAEPVPTAQLTGIPASEAPQAALNARQDLAQKLNIPVDEITIVSVEGVEWPDGCLGVHTVGIMCLQVITPGYRVVLEANGKVYEYHTNENGSQVILAGAPIR
ncbi:MAG TPA: hypothetical protein VFL17_23510 [Anaerolineae bacterium]|nr:hypothetical protein [Anaerolineae bacterium]